MIKYEYMECGLGYKSLVWIGPAQKFTLEELSKIFIQEKVERAKDSIHTIYIIPSQEGTGLLYRVINFLGSEGWEPFAVSVTQERYETYHFRRSY